MTFCLHTKDGGTLRLLAPSASWVWVNNYRWTTNMHTCTHEEDPIAINFQSSLIRTWQPKHPSSVCLLIKQNAAFCPCFWKTTISLSEGLCVVDSLEKYEKGPDCPSWLPWYQRSVNMVWRSSKEKDIKHSLKRKSCLQKLKVNSCELQYFKDFTVKLKCNERLTQKSNSWVVLHFNLHYHVQNNSNVLTYKVLQHVRCCMNDINHM